MGKRSVRTKRGGAARATCALLLLLAAVFLISPPVVRAYANTVSDAVIDQARNEAEMFLSVRSALWLKHLDDYNAWLTARTNNPAAGPEPTFSTLNQASLVPVHLSASFPVYTFTPSGKDIVLSRTLTTTVASLVPNFLPMAEVSGGTVSLHVGRPGATTEFAFLVEKNHPNTMGDNATIQWSNPGSGIVSVNEVRANNLRAVGATPISVSSNLAMGNGTTLTWNAGQGAVTTDAVTANTVDATAPGGEIRGDTVRAKTLKGIGAGAVSVDADLNLMNKNITEIASIAGNGGNISVNSNLLMGGRNISNVGTLSTGTLSGDGANPVKMGSSLDINGKNIVNAVDIGATGNLTLSGANSKITIKGAGSLIDATAGHFAAVKADALHSDSIQSRSGGEVSVKSGLNLGSNRLKTTGNVEAGKVYLNDLHAHSGNIQIRSGLSMNNNDIVGVRRISASPSSTVIRIDSDLDLNGKDILNVRNVDATGNVTARGNVVVDGNIETKNPNAEIKTKYIRADFFSSSKGAATPITVESGLNLDSNTLSAGTTTLGATTTGALTADSLNARTGAIQTTGTLSAGTTTLGATTTGALTATGGATVRGGSLVVRNATNKEDVFTVTNAGELSAGTTTLGATTTGALTADSLNARTGAIQTTGTLSAGTTTLGATTTGALTATGGATVRGGSLVVRNATNKEDVFTVTNAGELSAGTTTLGATTTGALTADSLNARTGAIQTTGTLSAGTTTLGATTTGALTATGGATVSGGSLVVRNATNKEDVFTVTNAGELSAGTTTLGATTTGALTADSLNARTGAIQTTGTLSAGTTTLGATTTGALTATGGATVRGGSLVVRNATNKEDVFTVTNAGELSAGTTTLGATTTGALTADSLNARTGAIQTTGTLSAGTTTLGATTTGALTATGGATVSGGSLVVRNATNKEDVFTVTNAGALTAGTIKGTTGTFTGALTATGVTTEGTVQGGTGTFATLNATSLGRSIAAGGYNITGAGTISGTGVVVRNADDTADIFKVDNTGTIDANANVNTYGTLFVSGGATVMNNFALYDEDFNTLFSVNPAGKVSVKTIEGMANSTLNIGSKGAFGELAILKRTAADGQLATTGNFSVAGATSLKGTLGVDGNATLSGTLKVTGITTLDIVNTGALTASSVDAGTGTIKTTGTGEFGTLNATKLGKNLNADGKDITGAGTISGTTGDFTGTVSGLDGSFTNLSVKSSMKVGGKGGSSAADAWDVTVEKAKNSDKLQGKTWEDVKNLVGSYGHVMFTGFYPKTYVDNVLNRLIVITDISSRSGNARFVLTKDTVVDITLVGAGTAGYDGTKTSPGSGGVGGEVVKRNSTLLPAGTYDIQWGGNTTLTGDTISLTARWGVPSSATGIYSKDCELVLGLSSGLIGAPGFAGQEGAYLGAHGDGGAGGGCGGGGGGAGFYTENTCADTRRAPWHPVSGGGKGGESDIKRMTGIVTATGFYGETSRFGGLGGAGSTTKGGGGGGGGVSSNGGTGGSSGGGGGGGIGSGGGGGGKVEDGSGHGGTGGFGGTGAAIIAFSLNEI